MDSSEFPIGNPSPRKELQGPRPTPLKVRKDSYKIKKPPIAPHPAQPAPAPPPQHRAPVIIYTVSPKVIHTKASDFMTLVQRLTGASSSSASPTACVSPSGGALSPAARLATIEKAQNSDGAARSRVGDLDMVDQLDVGGASWDRSGNFPGILSPVPSSLPPISPNFFSPSVDPNSLSFLHDMSPIFQDNKGPNSLSFLHDMSPIFQDNKGFVENTFLPSPNPNFLATLPSPSAYWDLFNQGF